jgi:nicotinate-nucleotide adenylyltransferase
MCPKTPFDRPLIFGGSFNPPHLGHTSVARAAAASGRFGALVLVPTKNPPHKPGAIDFAPAEHRLAMLRLAFREVAGCCVSDLEITREGKSYTYDTAEQFLNSGSKNLQWLIGADWITGLSTWHRWQELRRIVTFVVVARPGYSIDLANVPHPPTWFRLDVEPFDVSGTDVRQRLATGKSVQGLIDPAVEAYIRGHRLYGTR